MDFSKLTELIKFLQIDEQYEVIVTESSITIKEASSGPSLEEFIKMYISDDDVKEIDGKYIIDTSKVMSANNFWKILTAAFNDKYDFKIEDEYTIIVVPNTPTKSESSEDLSLEIAKYLDEKGFNVTIKEDGSIAAFGEKTEDLANELDSKYENLDIELFDEKLKIKIN